MLEAADSCRLLVEVVQGVQKGHMGFGMPCGLQCLWHPDFLCKSGDGFTPEAVKAEAGIVEAQLLGGGAEKMLEDVTIIPAHAPVGLHGENEFLSSLRPRIAFSQQPGLFTQRNVPYRLLALGNVQVATIVALAHHDFAVHEINVFALESENFADPQRAEQRRHDDQSNVVSQCQEKSLCVCDRQFPLLTNHSFAAHRCELGRIFLLPESPDFRLPEDATHQIAEIAAG